MPEFAGFPFCEVRFDKKGKIQGSASAVAVQAMLDGGITDLIVISHGWNNDDDEARGLYERFAQSARNVIARGTLPVADCKLAFLRVFWPSKKFRDDDAPTAGGAASVGSRLDKELDEQFDLLEALIDDPEASAELEGLRARIDDLADDPDLQDAFVDTVRRHLSATDADAEDASDRFFSRPGSELLADLAKPIGQSVRSRRGGAATTSAGGRPRQAQRGGAALFGLGGLKSAVNKLLNMSTYYEMKGLAGTVGREGVCPLLHEIQVQRPGVRIHLVGHSFGGRLVASVALTATHPQTTVSLSSMSLLQAAFSHHGFAKDFDNQRDGFFRAALEAGPVKGPIIVTHTINDTAVGRLYPLASQLVGDDAAAIGLLGDALDAVGGAVRRFGGIGRNGAQHTPEALSGELLALDGVYSLSAGKVHNLEASAFITNHSDVTGEQVAQAVLAAIASGR
jgi:hypothetical protein